MDIINKFLSSDCRNIKSDNEAQMEIDFPCKHTTLTSCIQIKWQHDTWLDYASILKSYKGL